MSREIAVVTGASGGLGYEICRQLAARGLRVAMLDRDPRRSTALVAALRRDDPDAVAGSFAVDLADHADIARCAASLRETFGPISVLFNNAGVLTESLQFSRYGNEMHFEVNTLAPLQLIDALMPSLRASGRGVVINTSAGLSLNAKTLEWRTLVAPTSFSKLFGPYVRSKAALNVLTAALAREHAADGVVLRAADPGPLRTKLTRGTGTPLWMRVFAPLLPPPSSGARTIVAAAFDERFATANGAFVSGGSVRALPPALADVAFQDELLERCRRRIVEGEGPDQPRRST